jgi:hypothetical protein
MPNLDVKRPTRTKQPTETPEEQEARVSREALIIARGRADIDAGLGIELDALEAWLERVEIDENAPMPVPGEHGPGR